MTILPAYAALLALVLLTPYATLALGPRLECHWPHLWTGTCALLLAAALILTVARGGTVPLLCALFLLPLVGMGTAMLLGGISAILFFLTITWWTTDLQFDAARGSAFALFALGAGWLARQNTVRPTQRSPLIWPMLLAALIGLTAGLLTAPFEAADPLQTAWHHWSAYLSPVEAWRGGGAPYRDFPIQSGVGPTLLLRATCGADCWRGMYGTAIVANALYYAILTGCVLILTARSPRALRWLGIIAMFAATFIWTGFPIQFAGPAMTPSVAGLRFIVIAALLLHILRAEQSGVRRNWIGHAIWLAALFWSAEAAAFATLIWWPYLALRDAGAASDATAALKTLVRTILRGAATLAIGGGAVALTLWLLSGRAMTLADFLAYVQHPPGALPVNPLGTIWIALAAIALALPLLARHRLRASARRLYACLLGFLVAGAYYLSRSHDNNILNLFPLLVLLLLAIQTPTQGDADTTPGFATGFVRTALTAMIAFIATFNFAPWQEGAAKTGPLTLGPAHLLARMTPTQGQSPALLPPDAVAAITWLRARHAGMVVVFDSHNIMLRQPGAIAWTPVNNSANYTPLPPPMIARYIARGAATYHRPGWIVVDTDHRYWVTAFSAAYTVHARKAFGSYAAYHVIPK